MANSPQGQRRFSLCSVLGINWRRYLLYWLSHDIEIPYPDVYVVGMRPFSRVVDIF